MDWGTLLFGIVDTIIYSMVGIIMMGIGFLIINFFTPFSVKKEIEDDQNTSLGIIIGSVIIGLAIIIASVIGSPSSSTKAKKVSYNTEVRK
jgi:putative membrane protein